MDEKTKIRQEQLIERVSSFCDAHLNDEYKSLCVKLVEKMGRKHNVPFKRGKLENWASGVVYAIAQINFLFDNSQELHTSPDEICEFFSTKKSTASNKARDIREMFNMGHFDSEFSAGHILDGAPKFYIDEKSGMIIPEELVNTDPMDEFFDNVYNLFDEGKVDEAMGLLDTIPEDSPEYGRALFYKSMFSAAQGDEDGGFKLFQEALMNELENNPEGFLGEDVDYTNPEELFDEGLLNYEMGYYADAIGYFDLAIDLKADDDEAFYYKSLSLAGLDEFDEALRVINKAININPRNDRYWNDKGNFLARLEDGKRAQECFDKALELKPFDSIIWSNKAFAYLEDEKYENALECYDKAIELAPDEVHPILGKANVYMSMADLDNAGKYFELARGIDENDVEYLTNYGHFMLIQQRFDEAIESWDKCLKIDKNLSMIWIYKALAYGGLENDEMMEECIEKACEIDPMAIFALDDFADDEEY